MKLAVSVTHFVGEGGIGVSAANTNAAETNNTDKKKAIRRRN
jgi:hypothetical protein